MGVERTVLRRTKLGNETGTTITWDNNNNEGLIKALFAFLRLGFVRIA